MQLRFLTVNVSSPVKILMAVNNSIGLYGLFIIIIIDDVIVR